MIVMMILDMKDKHGLKYLALALWKHDLANAFALMNIHPDDAHLLAVELTETITLIHTAGSFGYTGTPAAFEIITRSLRFVISHDIHGRMTMYVDDMIGCSTTSP